MAAPLQPVAEINYHKACFGFKTRQKPTLDVLDQASAAARAQEEDAHVVLWADLQLEAVFLTEQWGADTCHRRLPINVCVKQWQPAAAAAPTGPGTSDEVSVAALEFADRPSAELFAKLTLTALPAWLGVRRSMAGRSLLMLADHWLVSEEDQALKLQHPDAHLSGLLQLDVHRACMEVVVMKDGQACKSYQVCCLDDVSKLLKKHSRPQRKLDKRVHTGLQELKPSASAAGRLLARLEAAVMGHKGATSLECWCRGGIVAALVDCAASLGSNNASHKDPQRQTVGGLHDHRVQEQQYRRVSTPGAALTQGLNNSIAALQALAECCAVVLQFGPESEQQAALLAACVGRVLTGSMQQAVFVLELLRMVLRYVGAAGAPEVVTHLHQACCSLRLLHQAQHCYSRSIPCKHNQQPQVQPHVLSHQLEGLDAEGASEPSTPSAPRLPGGSSLFDQQATPAGELLCSCPDSPQLAPHSPAATPAARRRSLVPKLHLPVPVTPAPGSSASRLSLESSGRVKRSSMCSQHPAADKAVSSGREGAPAGPSFLRAVQQLGHSCGQSVMAADLAAFVTHKQLLGGVVAVEAALQHSRPAVTSALPGASQGGSLLHPTRLSFEQLSRLPLPAQLQVQLLELLLLLCEKPASELLLPRSWEHLLLAPLLVPKAAWLQHGSNVSGVLAGRERALTSHAYNRIRAVTLKLLQRSNPVWHPHGFPARSLEAAPSPAAGAQVSLHSAVLEQFKMRLVAASSSSSRQQHDTDASAHGVCAELLLLLRDCLRVFQQPLADTACFMLGGVLAQQEHMLRSTRLEHWSFEAVLHMDALVQLYEQLMSQVTTPGAAAWLLTLFGVQVSSSRAAGPLPSAAGSGGGSSSNNSGGNYSPGPAAPLPSDSLQLVLTFLQSYLTAMAAAADSCSMVPAEPAASALLSPSLKAVSRAGGSSTPAPALTAADSAAAGCGAANRGSELSPSVLSALGQMGQPPSSGGVLVMQLKANCWRLLGRLLLLAAQQPALRTQGPPSCSRMLGGARSGSIGPPGAGSRTPSATASPKPHTAATSTTTPGRQAGSLTPNRRPSLPLLALPNSGSFSRTPSTPAAGAAADGGSGSDPLMHCSMAGSDASAPGRCSIWQLLVELLMISSSMGQAAVLQHLAETHSNRLLLPLQEAVADFLCTALGMPNSYAFSKPQLAEFYVHHHFLHFTQHYHKLPTSLASGSAVLCKSHLQVLLALCRQTGGANQVRRRFLQLKVLEFLAREASLEYMCARNQLAASPGSSSCSTPLSTSRTGRSCRTSARYTTDPGGTAAAGGGGGGGRGLPPIPLGALLGSAAAAAAAAGGGGGGSGPSRESSARGSATSRLWVSSPGTHLSARVQSAQSTQRSWGAGKDTRNSADDHSTRVSIAPACFPQSFELDTFRAPGADLLLTGTSSRLSVAGLHNGEGSTHAAADLQQEQPQLGSKVRAAVQALESAAAAVAPQILQPQPPKSAAPTALGGRRQPGHMRLVCAAGPAAGAASSGGHAAAAGVAAVPPAPGSASNGQQPKQHQCSSSIAADAAQPNTEQPPAAAAAVPKLKLPCGAVGGVRSSSSSTATPAQHSGRVVWQSLEAALDARAAASSVPAAEAAVGALSSRSSASSSALNPASPRADLLSYQVPASVRSQRRVKQPDLTGDASHDNIIIDEWERETGLEFRFDGLSDSEHESTSSSSSSGDSSNNSTPRGGAVSSAAGQTAAGTRGVLGAGSSACTPALPPQTPGVDAAVQAQSAAACGPEGVSAPRGPLVAAPAWPQGCPGVDGSLRPGRWLSSSDSLQEACTPAADMQHILGDAGIGLAALVAADDAAGTIATPATKWQVPRLAFGALPAASSSSPRVPPPAAASLPQYCGQPVEPPLSYRPGLDLEEDFERLREAGDWDDSSSCCCSGSSNGGSTLGSPARPASLQRPAPLLLLQQQSPQRQQPPQPRQAQQQQQSSPPPDAPAAPAAATSPDTRAPADVHAIKRRSPKRQGNKARQLLAAGSRSLSEPQAHALADCSLSGSSSSSGSDREGQGTPDNSDSESESLCGCSAPKCPTPPGGVLVPKLNLPQLQQASWHLPMSATVLPSNNSSEAGGCSSQRTAVSSGTRGATYSSVTNLSVLPLTTTRPSKGGDSSDSGRSGARVAALDGCGPGSSQPSEPLPPSARAWSAAGAGAWPYQLPHAATEYVPCTPLPAHSGALVDPSQGPYAVHRAKCAMYIDAELHVMCLELALHLLATPTGQLDPVQLPHEPSDTSLQRKVLLLLEHMSHSANLPMACRLAHRACSTLRQHKHQQQHPLPIYGSTSTSTQQVPHESTGCGGEGPLACVQQPGSSTAATAAPHSKQLQQACSALRESTLFIRTSSSSGGSSGSGSSAALSSMTAADAAAGLAGSTLRLLKLLSLHALDLSGLTSGSMINKGAFSEVLSGTLQQPGCPLLPVALKVMDCNEDDACCFERVYNEVASLEALRGQPAVVPLLEYGVTASISGQRQWVLVFPKYAGSLRDWRLRWQGKGLDTADLPVYLSVFLQVARAVAVLHSFNIVHFDIKGDNVLLQHGFDPSSLCPSSTGSSDVVLADFGDALMLEHVHASSQRHRGTELFSSPEMLLLHAGRQHAQHAQHDRRKHKGVHAAHDVWSLGCTLYELLTGTVLFEDEGVGRITSYSSSQSSGGGAQGLRPDARGWGVLNVREKAALQNHTGCIELVECMLVGEPNWRPSAEQVVAKTQRLLAAVLNSDQQQVMPASNRS